MSPSPVKLTKLDERVLETVRSADGEISPTQIGVQLGYAYASASSRVAPALAKLVAAGLIAKKVYGHNTVTYYLA